jgi:hypothetical protein
MPNKKSDETLGEILEADNSEVRKRKPKNIIVRLLLIITILVVFFFGFLYVTQYLADMEAEARVRAIMTLNTSGATGSSGAEAVATLDAAPTETSEVLTPTTDPELERTATIAAQLTSVAEFQSTETPAE